MFSGVIAAFAIRKILPRQKSYFTPAAIGICALLTFMVLLTSSTARSLIMGKVIDRQSLLATAVFGAGYTAIVYTGLRALQAGGWRVVWLFVGGRFPADAGWQSPLIGWSIHFMPVSCRHSIFRSRSICSIEFPTSLQIQTAVHRAGLRHWHVDANPNVRLIWLGAIFVLPLVVTLTRLIQVQRVLPASIVATYTQTTTTTEPIDSRDGRILAADGRVPGLRYRTVRHSCPLPLDRNPRQTKAG